ncbi:MAG: hypothetical protein HRT52_19390 [Colwellia sp.]|nr:hypothetical protein [Colwellia sp.]
MNKNILKNGPIKVGLWFLVISLTGCFNDSSKYCSNIEPVVEAGNYFFEGVVQPIEFVSGSDNPLAVSCHNCYQNSSASALDTIQLIESAIANGVDLIELDVTMSDEIGMNLYVSHESDVSGPLLGDVVESPVLINATQILFIEIKGQLDQKETIRSFFRSLMKHEISNGTYAYFNAQRFTVVRSSETDKTLHRFREVLTETEFENIKPFVRLSRLFSPTEESKMYAKIDEVYACGFHMIELDTRTELSTIKILNSYAEMKGLSVNVFTVDKSNYIEVMSALKDDVDVITVESRVNDEVDSINSNLLQSIKAMFFNGS